MLRLGMLLLMLLPAWGQHHHPGASPSLDHFYSTWMRPDSPHASCCNKMDCYSPERVELRGVDWYFERREDHKMVRVPPQKIEMNRDNPDGRNHVCASPPMGDTAVYCFIVGAGL